MTRSTTVAGALALILANGAAQADDRKPSLPSDVSAASLDDVSVRVSWNGSRDDVGLDGSKWNSRYRWGPGWTINGERQYYVDMLNNPDFGYSPFELDGEHLSIIAIRTPDRLRSSANWKDYLSGALTTYGKFRMRYGYVEARARMPSGRGLWPAFRLLHSHDGGARPEIDVVESLGKDRDRIYNTYRYYQGRRPRSTPSYVASGDDLTAGFHTYGMRWEPGRIVWYLDGREVNRYESGNVSNEDMYLLLNLALGGSRAGDPDGGTPFPARYTIDYIRAYARN